MHHLGIKSYLPNTCVFYLLVYFSRQSIDIEYIVKVVANLKLQCDCENSMHAQFTPQMLKICQIL